jgi:hypothetical protein
MALRRRMIRTKRVIGNAVSDSRRIGMSLTEGFSAYSNLYSEFAAW